MHREQHNEGKSKKWLWITLTVAVIVLVGISAYLAGQLSSVKKEASSAESVESSKVISSSSDNDSDTNNDEDTNNDTDDNNNTNDDTNNNKADKNTDNTDDNGDIAQRIGNLKTMSVCACLLVQPDWFKTTNVTYSENGQQGTIQDSDGNTVTVEYNSVNCVTITTRNAHNAEGKTIKVTPNTLYTDYYNTQKKQEEVNGYVNNLN